ncbi:MAG: hypothetical protein RR330_05490 [Alistipes sp.]
MNYEVSISHQKVLDACIVQTSLDFRGLRIIEPVKADAICDDFTMSADDRAAVAAEMRIAAMYLNLRLKNQILSVSIGEESINYVLSVNDKVFIDCVTLTILMETYFKNRILSWWYSGRNENLWSKYIADMASSVENIVSVSIPKFTERKLRYF